MKIIMITLLVLVLLETNSLAGEPVRALGLSAHMLPEQVAALDQTGKLKPGFVVAPQNKIKQQQVFSKPEKLLLFFKTLSSSVRSNGLWIVTTHPAAYSANEIQALESLKKMSREQKITLFICRGSKLPSGCEKAE
jgi:hypothetical protein